MRVLILVGGDSSERQVSLDTGAACYAALKRLGHQVIAIDPVSGCSLLDNNGKFLTLSDEQKTGHSVTSPNLPRALADSLAAAKYQDIDVVFIALHGGTGENGTIQNLLELAGMKYTGSDMTASAVAMNKALAKHLMQSIKVQTPAWRSYPVTGARAVEVATLDIASHFKPSIIVKPVDGGSTVGLTKVDTVDGIAAALEEAAKHSCRALIEEFVQGRELTVAVFDGRALPVIEIRPTNELYDYEAKYTKGKSEYIAPAPIDDALARNVQEAAVKVYNVIGASGMARVDFILSGDGTFYCLELNTLPGMTGLSLVPMAFKCEGVDFDQLVSMIVNSALKRPTPRWKS